MNHGLHTGHSIHWYMNNIYNNLIYKAPQGRNLTGVECMVNRLMFRLVQSNKHTAHKQADCNLVTKDTSKSLELNGDYTKDIKKSGQLVQSNIYKFSKLKG